MLLGAAIFPENSKYGGGPKKWRWLRARPSWRRRPGGKRTTHTHTHIHTPLGLNRPRVVAHTQVSGCKWDDFGLNRVEEVPLFCVMVPGPPVV